MSYADPWCAAFVSAVGFLAGLTGVLLPECSCDAMIAKYRAAARWHAEAGYRVQAGDLVFYNWDGDRTSDHVGIVSEVTGTSITVIEGNKSDAVGTRVIPKDWPLIHGFAAPDYAAGAALSEDEGGEAGGEEEVCAAAAQVPILARGDRSVSVLVMQAALIARGFGCGPDGADGDFGENTERAVKRFQTHKQLDSDGVCGPRTWEKLLGVKE